MRTCTQGESCAPVGAQAAKPDVPGLTVFCPCGANQAPLTSTFCSKCLGLFLSKEFRRKAVSTQSTVNRYKFVFFDVLSLFLNLIILNF